MTKEFTAMIGSGNGEASSKKLFRIVTQNSDIRNFGEAPPRDLVEANNIIDMEINRDCLYSDDKPLTPVEVEREFYLALDRLNPTAKYLYHSNIQRQQRAASGDNRATMTLELNDLTFGGVVHDLRVFLCALTDHVNKHLSNQDGLEFNNTLRFYLYTTPLGVELRSPAFYPQAMLGHGAMTYVDRLLPATAIAESNGLSLLYNLLRSISSLTPLLIPTIGHDGATLNRLVEMFRGVTTKATMLDGMEKFFQEKAFTMAGVFYCRFGFRINRAQLADCLKQLTVATILIKVMRTGNTGWIEGSAAVRWLNVVARATTIYLTAIPVAAMKRFKVYDVENRGDIFEEQLKVFIFKAIAPYTE